MKRKNIYSIIFFSVVLLSTSCSNAASNTGQEKVYNSMTTYQTAENTQTTASSHNETDNTSDGLFVDFDGLAIDYTNIEGDGCKICNTLSGIVCRDENDVIYYVNYGEYEDNYIYEYKDGESTLLVDKICNFINYSDGKLYFLVDDKPPERFPWSYGGDLYCYDISEKDTNILLQKNISNLFMYNDVLYFCIEKADPDHGGDWCYMKIGETECHKMDDLLPFFYGDYQLAFSTPEHDNCGLSLVIGDKSVEVAGIHDYKDYRFTLYNDSLWISYFDNDNVPTIARIELGTGNKKLYRSESITKSGLTMNMTAIPQFTVLNSTLYVVSDSSIFVYDEEQEYFDRLLHDHTNYSDIYSDGEYLYALSFDGPPHLKHSNDITKIDVSTDPPVTEMISQ